MGIREFHESTVKELIAVKDRVRNLIDHWGEDGRHKEAVLKNIIRRFLPEKFRIGTGFVVSQTLERTTHQASPQIDLIIYDSSFPVLFREGDFVILTPDAVNGIIEVKTNLANQDLQNVLNKSNELGHFIVSGKEDIYIPFFNGIFSYEGLESQDAARRKIRTALDAAQRIYSADPNKHLFLVNHIAFNENLFYKYWQFEEENNRLYSIGNLSFAFFISNLIDFIGSNSVEDNRNLWFPIDKEFHQIEIWQN